MALLVPYPLGIPTSWTKAAIEAKRVEPVASGAGE